MANTKLFDAEPVERWMQPGSEPYVTQAIIAVNVIVFVAMIAVGGFQNLSGPTADTLIKWQANWAPMTLGGEPWRLLTACFLHIGFVHILFNMIVLWQVGVLCEKLYGHSKYLVLYLLTGIAGSVLSDVLTNGVCAGASGAIAGIIGAYVGLLYAHKRDLEPQVFTNSVKSMGGYILYCVIYGIMVHADHAAHFGGLLVGAILGYAMVPKISKGSIGTSHSAKGAGSDKVAESDKVTESDKVAHSDIVLDSDKVAGSAASENPTDTKAFSFTAHDYRAAGLVAVSVGMCFYYACSNNNDGTYDLRLGTRFANEKNYAEATNYWRKALAQSELALKKAPGNTAARLIHYSAARSLNESRMFVADSAALLKEDSTNADYILKDAGINAFDGDPDRALAECEALPDNATAYQKAYGTLLEAQIYVGKGDFPKALALIDRCHWTENLADMADILRASIYIHTNQFDKAKLIVDKLLIKTPEEHGLLQMMAQIAWNARDYQKVCDWTQKSFDSADPTLSQARAYPALLNFLAAERCNRAEPDKLLKQIFTSPTTSEWSEKIASFLLGKLSEDKLIADAKGNGQLTEAHAYIGLHLAHEGRKAEAKEQLDWVIKNGVRNYVEYTLASIELKYL